MTSVPLEPAALIDDAARRVRRVAASLDRQQRARLVYDIVRAVYDEVRFADPEGGGLDGRDGPERTGLATISDAARRHLTTITQMQSQGNLAASRSTPSAGGGGGGAEDSPAAAEEGVDSRLDGPRQVGGHSQRGAAEEFEWSVADPTESFQREVTRPGQGDENPIELTVYQAEKCAAILHAYIDDHTDADGIDRQSLNDGPARLAAHLLTIRAVKAKPVPGRRNGSLATD